MKQFKKFLVWFVTGWQNISFIVGWSIWSSLFLYSMWFEGDPIARFFSIWINPTIFLIWFFGSWRYFKRAGLGRE